MFYLLAGVAFGAMFCAGFHFGWEMALRAGGKVSHELMMDFIKSGPHAESEASRFHLWLVKRTLEKLGEE